MRYDSNKAVHIWVMASDWAAILLSLLLTSYICNDLLQILTYEAKQGYTQYVFLVLMGYIFGYLLCGNYENFINRGIAEEFLSVSKNQMIMLALTSISMIVMKNGMLDSRYMYVMEFAITFFMVFLARILMKKFLKHYYKGDKRATLVALIADCAHIEKLLENLKGQWHYKVQGIVIIDKDMTGEHIGPYRVTASGETMMDWIRRTSIDEVIIDKVYLESIDSSKVEEMEDMGITVHISLPFLEDFKNYSEKVTTFDNYVALTLSASNSSNYEKLFIKRLIDIIIGLTGSILSIPIILITAVPLLIESPGPLFFTQVRVGLNGRRFKIYKLRSMYMDAEQRKKDLMDKNEMDGLMFKMKDDPRNTKVGKFIRATSIDELPQFFNVLKGDMSFVGTRPPTEDEFMQYKNHHRRRLSMKPGVTGLWQVSGRSDIKNFEEVVKLDVKYIDTWSLTNDFKIMLRTVKVVFMRMGSG